MRFIQGRYYVPNNMALIVTGDINPAQIFAYADSLLGDWAARRRSVQRRSGAADSGTVRCHRRSSREADVGAVTVLIQWQGPSVRRDRATTYAADVFSDALNTKGSRFQRLLTDSGLWTAIGVNYYTLDQVGPITISGQTTPERLKEALAVLWREIEKLDDPGYFYGGRAGIGEGATRNRQSVRHREDIGAHAHDRFLVGGGRSRLLHGIRGQHGATDSGRPAAVCCTLHCQASRA